MAGKTARGDAEDSAMFPAVPPSKRQTLLTWLAEQQRNLQDFIREQVNMQQQLLQNMMSPAVVNGNQAQALGCCKTGPADDHNTSPGLLKRVAMGEGWDREPRPCS